MKRRTRVLACGWVLVLAAVPVARAQDPASPPVAGGVDARIVAPGRPLAGWTAEATVGRDYYVSDNAIWRPWTSAELQVARRFTGGSIGVGVTEVRRFDRRDGAWSVDVYRALWSGAHGNVRAQVAREGVVLPASDVSAELYQALGSGWEPSVGFRRLGYDDPVFLSSLSLGKYVGDRWYGRVRGTMAERGGGGGGTFGSALLRRYLGSSREFLELSAGGGEEAVTAGVTSSGSVVVDIRSTGFLEAGGRKYLTRHFGGMVSGSYHTFEAIPDRAGGRVGIVARF